MTPATHRSWTYRGTTGHGLRWWSCDDAIWRVFATWAGDGFRVVGLDGEWFTATFATPEEAMRVADGLPDGMIRGEPTPDEMAQHLAELRAAMAGLS